MRKPVPEGSDAAAIIADEQAMLGRVHGLLDRRAPGSSGGDETDYDRELIALRDQIADEKPEDLPSLVEQMTRVSAIASGRRGKLTAPIDVACPYFAHMRLRTIDPKRPASGAKAEQDVLIGRRGLIDRAAGVQIVDWRDAPVSQIYYRYDEGDDYEEEVGGAQLKGEVLARRNVTIAASRLRRIGCPQGTFVSSIVANGDGDWFELEGQGVALLEGGAGTAARPPRSLGGKPHKGRPRRFETARTPRVDNKQLPEIAALIDRAQFDLITEKSHGLVVIQGGAGSGKTTVALHRIAYLIFNDKAFKPSRCLFVVPSDALERYVSGVLPALGVNGVPVVTYRSWARNLRRRLVPNAPDSYAEETPAPVSRLKKHPAMLRVLEAQVAAELAGARAELERRLAGLPGASWVLTAWDNAAGRQPARRPGAVRRQLATDVERSRDPGRAGPLDVPVETAHAAEQALRRLGARLRDVRRMLAEALTDRTRLELLSAPGVIEPASVRDLEELVRWASAQLEEALPQELEGIDEERLQPIDGLPLDASDGTTEGRAKGKLDVEDDPLLLRLYQLVHGRFERVDGAPLEYDHIAVDEAQDLSAVDMSVIYHALDEKRSLTIAGDVAQRVIFDNAFRGWQELLGDVGVREDAALLRPLRLAYRSTAPVMRFARAVLGPLAAEQTDLSARDGADVQLHELPGMGEAVAFVADALRSLLGREPSASVALLTRHAGQADAWYNALVRAEVPQLRRVRRQDFPFAPGVDVTDVGQVKGLEFDYVILLDVNDSSYPATVESRHLLHIGATRATHQLWLIATGPVSELVAPLARPEGEVVVTEEEGAESAG